MTIITLVTGEIVMCEPFVCDDCENAKPIYRDRLCEDCWKEWQQYMDHLAVIDGEEVGK